MSINKFSRGLIFSASAMALSLNAAVAQVDEVIVTAEKRAENIQDVSAAVTALGSDAIAAAGIQDITRLENVVPGLRIGSSGGEVRPAMRGARTNEVGVAGTGIAEQVVGIFLDGVYVPTTTAGMGTYLDVDRIEVLRGPQGTLYGRNTFAGTINVVTNEPVIGEYSGNMKVTLGDYARTDAQYIMNIPMSDSSALRIAASSEKRDGYVENTNVRGTSDDLKARSQSFARATYKREMGDNELLLRLEHSQKDANSDAIWGYQQLAGYQNGTAIQGHIYGSYTPAAPYTGETPYKVDRNAISFDRQETNALTLQAKLGGEAMDTKLILNYSKLSGEQFYDNDYTPSGSDVYGGFGRQDDHETISAEAQFTSNGNSKLSWVAGAYYFDQEADWEWLWRTDDSGLPGAPPEQPVAFANTDGLTGQDLTDAQEDYVEGLSETYNGVGGADFSNVGDADVAAALAQVTDAVYTTYLNENYNNLDGNNSPVSSTVPATAYLEARAAHALTGQAREPDRINVPGWGNPSEDPHTTESMAIFGQLTYELNDTTRLIGGLRFNDDSKTFTGTSIADWSDDATTYKAAVERDLNDDTMVYGSYSTGIRTGGANDSRTVSRGAPALYDNEEVTSMEVGYKTVMNDNTMVLNIAAYQNEYADVKAQLFAVACNDLTDNDAAACAAAGTATTFEYYQNGGDSSTTGLEVELQYAPDDKLDVRAILAYTDAEFDSDYTVGNDLINPLAGLGNYQGRQTGNTFNMGGMAPAFSPELAASVTASYTYELFGGTMTPSILFNWLDDYYTFDVNLPENLQESHTKTDLRVSWTNGDGVTLEGFILNLEDEAVLARTVVHSQIVGGAPINSVQANWNPPQTIGFSVGLEF